MKDITLNIPVQIRQEHELSEADLALLCEARRATQVSYAPYSHFMVGAAVLLDDGTIVPGCNQENSSTPCGICAERSAIFAAGAMYPQRSVRAICVAARDTSGEFTSRPIAPCGACRQVLCETEDRHHTPMRVLLYGTDGTYILSTAHDLLPLTFDGTYL